MKRNPLPAFEACITVNTPKETTSWRVEAETLAGLRQEIDGCLYKYSENLSSAAASTAECHERCHESKVQMGAICVSDVQPDLLDSLDI